MRNRLDQANIEHGTNIINAYMMYQLDTDYYCEKPLDNIALSKSVIYEYTGHIKWKNTNNTEIQLKLKNICNELHCHLSRILLGNNWRITKYQHMQPAILWYYDQEGTRQRNTSTRCLYPHVQGFIIIHKNTLDLFLSNTLYNNNNGRRYLLNNTNNFSEVSFGEAYNGVNGIMRFIDYNLKFEKSNRIKGNSLYSWDLCPSNNKSWNKYYKEIPDKLLHVYKI